MSESKKEEKELLPETLEWEGMAFGHLTGYLFFADDGNVRYEIRREHGTYIVPWAANDFLKKRVKGEKIGFYDPGADHMNTHKKKILDEDDAIDEAKQWCERHKAGVK